MTASAPSTSSTQRRFDGKVVLITGGGTGFGRAAAIAFAKEGARVCVTGRTTDTLNETVKQVQAAGGQALSVVGDVTKAADVQAMVSDTVKAYGRLDCLINNAGVVGKGQLLCDLDEETYDRVFNINAKGVWLGMKYAIPEMLKNGGGTIVNIASNQGLFANSRGIEYVGSKHAVVGMTKAAAMDYGRAGIRVNGICPAAHDTDMTEAYWRTHFPEGEWQIRLKERMEAMYPATGRIGKVREVVDVMLFLCSDASSNIHGVSIPVDGGFSVQ